MVNSNDILKYFINSELTRVNSNDKLNYIIKCHF